MSLTPAHARPFWLSPELINIVGTSGAIFAVVATGSAFSEVLPVGSSVWLFSAGYLGPAGLAYAVYWWIAQRL